MHKTFARWTLTASAACLVGLAATAATAADGLNAPAGAALWPAWQARLSFTLAGGDRGLQVAPVLHQAALLGDYYPRASWLPQGGQNPHWQGGLRATSGVVLGSLGSSVATTLSPLSISQHRLGDATVPPDSADLTPTPYVGIGYSGWSTGGGWGFSADLGLLVRQPGGVTTLGRALLGNAGLDEALRRLDLAPVLRLGVRYSF